MTGTPPASRRRGYPLMRGPQKKRRVFARFPATCTACNKPHIRPGDEIVKDALGWACPRCVSKRDSATAIDRRVQRLMLSLHNVALGTWGIPAGAIPTDSYAEFYGKALSLGVCSQHEFDVMRSKLADVWESKDL